MRRSTAGVLLLLSFLVDLTTCAANDQTCSGAQPSYTGPVAVSWGEAQEITTDVSRQRLQQVQDYMDTVVSGSSFDGVRNMCVATHKDCIYWASLGECETNPKYMLLQCAPACLSCEQLDYNRRCQFDSTNALWKDAGMIEPLFERLKSEWNATTVLNNPWVVTVDDFVSPEDCQALIDWGAKLGYERSVDAGKILEDGTMSKVVSEKRTSKNAWCTGACYEDEVTQRVVKKVEDILQIPREHFEYFQLLKYGQGEFYRRHNDFNRDELTRPQGNRILTVYLYLNEPEAGGGTGFPALDTKVMPRTGRALIWPSVLDSNPFARDDRTDHEALPVEAGLKYGANIWVHQRDFQAPFEKSCI